MKQRERQLQIECVKLFRLKKPLKLIFHIPNGGSRNVIEARNLKLMGVTPGVPDLFIPEAKLFIELKSDKGKLTENQRIIQSKLIDAGYRVEVVRSVEEFLKIIENA